jgi:hypothetical protein
MEDPMSTGNREVVSVRVIPNTTGTPPGKLADAEMIFEAEAGPLCGLKLIGFSIWERRTGGRKVTFPARQYSVNGERRSFALLRPANGDISGQEAVRDFILEAFTLSFARIRSRPRLILRLIAGQDNSCCLRSSSRFALSH